MDHDQAIRNCFFEACQALGGGAIACDYDTQPTDTDARIEACVFNGNQALFTGDEPEPGGRPYGGGAVFLSHARVDVLGCTFYDNTARWGGAIYSTGSGTDGSEVSVRRTIIANGRGETVRCFAGGSVSDVACSNFNANIAFSGHDPVNWVGCVEGYAPSEENDNLCEEPLFCGEWNGDFHLSASSPCAPWNSPCSALIGALDVGCGLQVVQDPTAHSPELVLDAPGIVHGRNAVEFRYVVPMTPRGQTIELRIEDASGRLVRRLPACPSSPGSHALSWNGLDEGGHLAPTGIYFCSLASSHDRTARRVLVVR